MKWRKLKTWWRGGRTNRLQMHSPVAARRWWSSPGSFHPERERETGRNTITLPHMTKEEASKKTDGELPPWPPGQGEERGRGDTLVRFKPEQCSFNGAIVICQIRCVRFSYFYDPVWSLQHNKTRERERERERDVLKCSRFHVETINFHRDLSSCSLVVKAGGGTECKKRDICVQ